MGLGAKHGPDCIRTGRFGSAFVLVYVELWGLGLIIISLALSTSVPLVSAIYGLLQRPSGLCTLGSVNSNAPSSEEDEFLEVASSSLFEE